MDKKAILVGREFVIHKSYISLFLYIFSTVATSIDYKLNNLKLKTLVELEFLSLLFALIDSMVDRMVTW